MDEGLVRTGGFEIIWNCENNAYASGVLGYHFPGLPNFGDITKVDWESVPKPDVLCGGFPCFAAGTLILTYDKGHTPIEDIRIGDLVLTHKGRWRKVTSTMQRTADTTFELSGIGFHSIITTAEHPFFARRQEFEWDNERRQAFREFSKPEWISVGTLPVENHQHNKRRWRFAQPSPPITEDNHSPDFWWVVGRYLADGWRVRRKWNVKPNGKRYERKNNGRIVIACGKAKFDETRRCIEKAFHSTIVEERTSYKFHITNTEFYRFIEQFGEGAIEKRIPGKFIGLPANLSRALFEGYMSGDGNTDKRGRRATTISIRLAYGLSLLFHQAYSRLGYVSYFKRPKTCVIEGRVCNQHDTYSVGFPDSNKSGFIEDGVGWQLLSSVSKSDSRRVYNISVEEDESYTANNFAVHNCQDLSVSGKGKGIKVGTRSGLWFEYAKAINVLRPKYVIVENVPMLIRRGINIVLADLSSAGYDAVWTDLRASDFGAIHRRERIFIVATRQEGYTPYCDCQRRDDRCDEAGIRTLEERELDSQDEERRRVFAALAERANAINGHFEKFLASALRRLPEFDWCQGIERIEDLFNQEGIPEPILRGEDLRAPIGMDAGSKEAAKSRRDANAERINRIKCVGNAVVPACAQAIGEYVLELENRKVL